MGIKQQSLERYSIARSRSAYQGMMIRAPVHDSDGIVIATATGTLDVEKELVINASGVGLVTGDKSTIVPFVPVVTCGNVASLFTMSFEGWDQFGDPTGVETNTKVSAALAETRFNLRAYSKFKRITVTPRNAAAAADTVEVGWVAPGAGIQARFALPYKSRRQYVAAGVYTGDWSPHCIPTNLGGGAFTGIVLGTQKVFNTAADAYPSAPAGAPNSSSEKSVVSMTLPLVTPNTAPIEFLVTMRDSHEMQPNF